MMFVVTLVFLLIYTIVALIQRNWLLVAKLAGVPSVADTIQEETHGVEVKLKTENTPDLEKA